MPQSSFITRKELAAVAEISEDTLLTKPGLKDVRKAMNEARDKICDRPIRYHRTILRAKLSLCGHGELAKMI